LAVSRIPLIGSYQLVEARESSWSHEWIHTCIGMCRSAISNGNPNGDRSGTANASWVSQYLLGGLIHMWLLVSYEYTL